MREPIQVSVSITNIDDVSEEVVAVLCNDRTVWLGREYDTGDQEVFLWERLPDIPQKDE